MVEEYFHHEFSRLTDVDRDRIASSYEAMSAVNPDYAMKIFVELFSEFPELKDVWPQFRAVPDSSLISCRALQKHAYVYSSGLKLIVEYLKTENSDGFLLCTQRIADSHRRYNVTKFHMNKIIPEIVCVIRGSTGDSSPETAAAWTKLCDILGNLINYHLKH